MFPFIFAYFQFSPSNRSVNAVVRLCEGEHRGIWGTAPIAEANRKQRWFCNGHACSGLSGKVTVLIVGLSLHVFQCLPGLSSD